MASSYYKVLCSPPVMRYSILGEFENSTQEPNVPSDNQPATQPTGFRGFQLNEASSSNQSTLAPSDLPTVSSH
jgi:hypothetical protein